MRFIIGLTVTIMICGCASYGTTAKRMAYIDDVAVPAELSSGYSVAAIDGRPAKRASGRVATVVPVVVVEAGEHTLSLEPKSNSEQQPMTLSAKIQAGKSYQLRKIDGIVSVVERE